jgi:hypothetical protein
VRGLDGGTEPHSQKTGGHGLDGIGAKRHGGKKEFSIRTGRDALNFVSLFRHNPHGGKTPEGRFVVKAQADLERCSAPLG